MYSKKTGESWSEPERLGILSDSLVAAHPALTSDGQTLYFVSDMAGGSGGKDIWITTRDGNAWSKPINADPI